MTLMVPVLRSIIAINRHDLCLPYHDPLYTREINRIRCALHHISPASVRPMILGRYLLLIEDLGDNDALPRHKELLTIVKGGIKIPLLNKNYIKGHVRYLLDAKSMVLGETVYIFPSECETFYHLFLSCLICGLAVFICIRYVLI